MRKIFTLVVVLCLGINSSAQCDPNPLYADSLFGVWPDTVTNFPSALVDEVYLTQLDLKVPSDASQIPNVDLPNIPIDSGAVTNVLGLPVGLSYDCNSHSPANCTFYGGQQGCATISGTATEVGTYNLTIQLTVYGSLGTVVVPYPIEFEGYRIVVEEPAGIEDLESAKPGLEQNVPNPFSNSTEIYFHLKESEIVDLVVTDLLGQEVLRQKIDGRNGENRFLLEGLELESGIYMYALQSKFGTVTRRMVVDRR